MPHQPPRQHLGDLGLHQPRIRRNQLAGKVGQQVIDPALAAQRLDHRVQPAELLSELGLEHRRKASIRPLSAVAILRRRLVRPGARAWPPRAAWSPRPSPRSGLGYPDREAGGAEPRATRGSRHRRPGPGAPAPGPLSSFLLGRFARPFTSTSETSVISGRCAPVVEKVVTASGSSSITLPRISIGVSLGNLALAEHDQPGQIGPGQVLEHGTGRRRRQDEAAESPPRRGCRPPWPPRGRCCGPSRRPAPRPGACRSGCRRP